MPTTEDTEMEDFIFDNFGKFIIIFTIGAFLMFPVLGNSECSEKTKGMGFNHEWTFLGGCKIEYKDGVWIPLNNYRVNQHNTEE